MNSQERLQQAQRRFIFALDLLRSALARCLFGSPAQKSRSMPESSAGEVIELHLGHQLGIERLPLHGMLGAPAARPARSFAGKSRRLDYLLQLSGQRQTLVVLNR